MNPKLRGNLGESKMPIMLLVIVLVMVTLLHWRMVPNKYFCGGNHSPSGCITNFHPLIIQKEPLPIMILNLLVLSSIMIFWHRRQMSLEKTAHNCCDYIKTVFLWNKGAKDTLGLDFLLLQLQGLYEHLICYSVPWF